MRREYTFSQMSESDLSKNPVEQFARWFAEAEQAVAEANAFALATSTSNGHPSSRMVLMKGWDEKGLLFFTNFSSRKGLELQQNPFAAATFYWEPLDRQVCIEGKVVVVPSQESDHYFANRPRGSQLSSWASKQDEILASRGDLEKSYHHFEEKFKDSQVPRPPYWGGLRLIPTRIEFWQGRENRLHDRIAYMHKELAWEMLRLSP